MAITIQKIARTPTGDYRALVSYDDVKGVTIGRQVIEITAADAGTARDFEAAIRRAVIADADDRLDRKPPEVPTEIRALEGQAIADREA